MVLFRGFFIGSIQIMQVGRYLGPLTNNSCARNIWGGRKGPRQLWLEFISRMIGFHSSAMDPCL